MLKLNGAWLCGLSSVPQGSGLSRLRSSGERLSADAISKIVKKNSTAMVHRDVRFNATLTTTTILATCRLRWEAEGIF
jgi:hypothetical protein